MDGAHLPSVHERPRPAEATKATFNMAVTSLQVRAADAVLGACWIGPVLIAWAAGDIAAWEGWPAGSGRCGCQLAAGLPAGLAVV